MNWVIIVVIMLAIVGSMAWVMPSPRDRMQAMLRQKAMRRGLQVQISRLLFPRALGEAEAEERNCTAYRLARPKVLGQGRFETLPWQIFRVQSHADTGLPPGWSWSKGERCLEDDQLALIAQVVEALPAAVYSLESTPLSVSVYWSEHGDLDVVDTLYEQLARLLEARL